MVIYGSQNFSFIERSNVLCSLFKGSHKRVALYIYVHCRFITVLHSQQFMTSFSILAVGYEARKFGVTRMLRGDEAKQKCPDIIIFNVPEKRGKADLTKYRLAGAEVSTYIPPYVYNIHTISIRLLHNDTIRSVIFVSLNFVV